MRPKTYYLLLLLILATIGLCAFGILNTQVSLKYETDFPANCVSHVTGKDLCKSLQTSKTLTGICIVVYLVVILFRSRIVKGQS